MTAIKKGGFDLQWSAAIPDKTGWWQLGESWDGATTILFVEVAQGTRGLVMIRNGSKYPLTERVGVQWRGPFTE